MMLRVIAMHIIVVDVNATRCFSFLAVQAIKGVLTTLLNSRCLVMYSTLFSNLPQIESYDLRQFHWPWLS